MNILEMAKIAGVVVSLATLIFGAYKFYVKRKLSKQNVAVDFTMGALSSGHDLSDAMIFLTARNTSVVPVHLKSFVLHFKKGEVEGQLIDGYGSNPILPSQVLPGDSLTSWHDMRRLAKNLAANGVTGKIDIKGYYTDGLNKKYYAKKPFVLDVDDWGK